MTGTHSVVERRDAFIVRLAGVLHLKLKPKGINSVGTP